jgi:hypothetical protein
MVSRRFEMAEATDRPHVEPFPMVLPVCTLKESRFL